MLLCSSVCHTPFLAYFTYDGVDHVIYRTTLLRDPSKLSSRASALSTSSGSVSSSKSPIFNEVYAFYGRPLLSAAQSEASTVGTKCPISSGLGFRRSASLQVRPSPGLGRRLRTPFHRHPWPRFPSFDILFVLPLSQGCVRWGQSAPFPLA